MSTEKAKKFYDRAIKSQERLLNSEKKFSDLKEIEDAEAEWLYLISEFHKIQKFVVESGKNLGRERWWKAVQNELKSNTALEYTFHARNADGHGLAEVSEETPPALSIGGIFSVGPNSTVKMKNMNISYNNGDRIEGDVNIKTDDHALPTGEMSPSVFFDYQPEGWRLLDVIDRGVVYKVPNKYSDNPVDLMRACSNWTGIKVRELEKMISKHDG